MNLNRIIADIKTAENNISENGNPTNDEYLYDAAAYHAQQAIEKELKYILHNIYGVDDTTKRFKTHNISTLLIQVNEHIPDFIDQHQNIVLNADEITNWEASTRYGEDLVSTKDAIKSVISYANDLLDEIKNMEKVQQKQFVNDITRIGDTIGEIIDEDDISENINIPGYINQPMDIKQPPDPSDDFGIGDN